VLGDDIGEPGAVQFLPYLSGERTPHNDPDIRGNFYGINHDCSRADMTRGILQGVAFAFQDCLSALQHSGSSVDQLLAVGGGSRSRVWLKTIATAIGLPIQIPAASEFGAAFGAARLGLTAASGADPTQVCTAPEIIETVDPDTPRIPAYQDAWRHYRSFYPALKEATAI
jgi:xylulokinase